MYEKYHEVRDEQLVSEYKKQRNDDIELELVDRYKIHSRKLASELYRKYKPIFQIEYEDLYSIALANLFVAINSFKLEFSFFKLWKRIATNEIKIYVTSMPLLYLHTRTEYLSTSRDADLNESTLVIAAPSYDDHESVLSSEIEKMLSRDKRRVSQFDCDIYILVKAGYSITDIAKETGLKYHYVRSRIEAIKSKIEKYFVHS